MLDREVAALPESYRRPIILCYLQGKTHDEAARLLGWPIGTVATRLTRARARLRALLEQRGWAVTSTALAGLLAAPAPAMSAEFVRATLRAALAHAAGQTAGGILSEGAVALSEGVLRVMWYSKLKTVATVVLALILAGTGIGLGVRQTWAQGGPDGPPALDAGAVPHQGPDDAALADQEGAAKAGDAKAQLDRLGREIKQAQAELRAEVSQLRDELKKAAKEISELKNALRQAAAPLERAPLYRGKPAGFWLEQAKDGDSRYRKEAVMALGALAQRNPELSKDLMPVLLTALKEEPEDGGVDIEAVKALRSLGAKAVPALVEVLNGDAKSLVRARAAEALGGMGPDAKGAVPSLIQAAKQNDLQLRRVALNTLAGIGPEAKAAVPFLIEALKDRDQDVRFNAMAALGAIGTEAKSAIPNLVEIMGQQLEKINKALAKGTPERPATVSIGRHESPGFVLDTLLRIDPSIRDLLPPDLSFRDTYDWDVWAKVYQVLKKKYPPTKE